MSYIIKTVSSKKEIEQGNTAEISIANWGGEYRPKSYAKVVFIENEGFYIKLWSYEKPLATFTEQNSGVCADSCLEFFANFKPQNPQAGYINLEGNANGALLACYGASIEGRKTLVQMGIEHPKAEPFTKEDCWGYSVMLPLKTIEQVYGNAEFKKGDVIKGSFFKCGDQTEYPHFLSYNRIEWDYPSFHRPQFYADMIIE